MKRHAELECARRRPMPSPVVPLAHLLACDECAEQVSARAREEDPNVRTDLYPGESCLQDEVLAGLARDRGGSPLPDHLRHCLWCMLSVRHFESQPLPVSPLAPRLTPPDCLRPTGDRRLAASAEISLHGDSLSVRSPLERRIRQLRLDPILRVRDIIPFLVTRQQLPVTAPDGTPMGYSLIWIEGKRRLEDGESLKEAGLDDGDHLELVPEILG